RQQPQRERRTNAFCVEHTLKDAPVERVRKSEELPAVFLDHEMGVQHDRLAGARQRLVDAERNRELVRDAAGGHHLDAIQLASEKNPRDLGDHARLREAASSVDPRTPITQASAAATPSAASAGCGADLRRSSRVSMNCTCSFVAAPFPTTAFLISAGGISWMSTPAWCPAKSTTPRA